MLIIKINGLETYLHSAVVIKINQGPVLQSGYLLFLY